MRCKDCPCSYLYWNRNDYEYSCGADMDKDGEKKPNKNGEQGCRLTARQAIVRQRRLYKEEL